MSRSVSKSCQGIIRGGLYIDHELVREQWSPSSGIFVP